MTTGEPDALDLALARCRDFARITGRSRLFSADGRTVVEWDRPASPVVEEDAALNPDGDDSITMEEDDGDE
jgi:hypothetical protein